MARNDDEEVQEETEAIEEEAAQEEAAPAATEFVPDQGHKPKSDVYTMLLILTFLAFLAGSIVAGREAWENYDVQFWVFNKEKKGGSGAAAEPAPAPAPAKDAAAPAPEPAPAPGK